MEMHSIKFKDLPISRAQPITTLLPLAEEALRSAGVTPERDLIAERFMSGQPRFAVIHGGSDHPPSVGMKETIRRAIRAVWLSDAIPFDIAQSIPCEDLSQGADAAAYGLLSRNLCAASTAAQMEIQGYDAAIVMGACDRMLVGNLRGLVETDLARQRRKARPVFAMVLPSTIGRDVLIHAEDRIRFEPLRHRMPEPEREQLDDLLRRPLKPAVYAGVKSVLDRCLRGRLIAEAEKDDLELFLVRSTGSPCSYCASSEASAVHRLMVASFGLVPRHCDISNKPVTDHQLLEGVKRLVTAVGKRERKVSVSGLIRSNLPNAISVWSATGGHPSWILHLPYLADAVGKKIGASDVLKRARVVPQILGIAETPENSIYAMSVEAEHGGNSGIDTVMRTLSERRWIDDRATTLDGSWGHRITEARSANGVFLHSTMTPVSKSCGVSGIHGNICTGGVVRVNRAGNEDGKVHLAVAYLGMRDLLTDLNTSDGILNRLKEKITHEDLFDTWKLNSGGDEDAAHWSKAHLWDYLEEKRLLPIIVVVAGIGPRAAGMPELQFGRESMWPVLTDGRVSGLHENISISHVVPEAFDGGPIAAIRTGDWIRFQLAESEIHVVCRNGRRNGVQVVTAKELMRRPDRNRRVHEIARRRLNFVPSFRILLDSVSSSDSGVSPCDRA
jgi:dihydroxyacid dehydratase/phosphogluconate dehydratase